MSSCCFGCDVQFRPWFGKLSAPADATQPGAVFKFRQRFREKRHWLDRPMAVATVADQVAQAGNSNGGRFAAAAATGKGFRVRLREFWFDYH